MPREQKGVKGGIDKDEARKQRQASSVELRKAKRDEGLQKRRNFDVEDASEPVAPPTGSELQSLASVTHAFVASNGAPEQFDESLSAVRSLRKLLSIANNPPIDDVIKCQLVPAFITLLQHPNDQMQFETAWCLTNIASGTTKQCETVVNANVIPALMPLLHSPSIDVSEQAVWALGNIAGDNSKFRNLVLAHGGLENILRLIEGAAQAGQISPLRNFTWALSNLMRGKPQPDLEYVRTAVPVLATLALMQDEDVIVDACWALSYISDGEEAAIEAVVSSGVVPALVDILKRARPKLQTPALRALSNIVTGSAEQTQSVIDAGFLPELLRTINATKMQTRKETCWAISNITAGTPEQVAAVLQTPNLMANVIQRFDVDEYDVKKEAAWAIANVLHGFKNSPSVEAAHKVSALVQLGCVKPMVNLLDVNDAAIQRLMLEACSNLLAAGVEVAKMDKSDVTNAFATAFDEAEGIDKLEALQQHSNEEVYSKAVEILETYFGEDEDEDENVMPNISNTGFSFGVQSTPLAPAQGFAF